MHLEGFRCFGKLIGHLLLKVFARVDPGNAVSIVRSKASSSNSDHSFDGIRDIILTGGRLIYLQALARTSKKWRTRPRRSGRPPK